MKRFKSNKVCNRFETISENFDFFGENYFGKLFDFFLSNNENLRKKRITSSNKYKIIMRLLLP